MISNNEDVQDFCVKTQSAVGRRIRAYRERQNLSIDKLASMAHVNHSLLGDIERGRGNPSVRTLTKLATSLDIDLALLFLDEADPASSTGHYSYTIRRIR